MKYKHVTYTSTPTPTMTSSGEAFLFCGVPLGYADTVRPLLHKTLGHHPHTNTDIFAYANYATTRLPDGLAIAVSYPDYTQDPSRIKVHLVCLPPDSKEPFSVADMHEWCRDLPYADFEGILESLGLTRTHPRFYAEYCKY